MRSYTMVRLACIVAVAWLAMPRPSWADTRAREVLAAELANASNLTAEQRAVIEERLRFLDALAQAKPMPMPRQAQRGTAAGPGQLVRFDPVTRLATEIGAAFVGEGQPTRAPGHMGTTLPGLGIDGGDGTAYGGRGVAGGCTPPPLDLQTWGFPWRTVVKLLMRFNVAGTDYFYVCSAATVSSFHLITAGHCLYNWDPDDDGDESDARWAEEVWAWPAQTDLVDPFGCEDGCPVEQDYPWGIARAVVLYGYTGWTEDHDHDHDMAYIALDRRIGDRVGWMGAEAGVETESLNFDGYPTETPYVPDCTIGPYPGFDEGNVTGYTEFRIELCAFVYGGHSGGPEWRYDGADRFIQGVNSTSDREGSAEGTRLTVGKFDDLYDEIIPDDEANIPPIARPELIEYVLDLDAKDLLHNTVCKGKTFDIEYNGYNVGFESTGTITVDFYLSTNNCISDSDYLVGSVVLGSIGGNTHFNPTTTLTVPCSVPNGTYYAGWILSCDTAEYNTDNNSVVIADETISVTETGPPAITLEASGGDVDESCVFLAPYSAVITDDCAVAVNSIEVTASSLDGLANVGTPTVDVEVVSETEVRVSGTVEVSELTGCPADVRIRVSAEDQCEQQTSRFVDIQVNDRIAPTIAVELDRYELWPPNHKLVTITATVEASDNCPNTSWILQSITSDEPDDGLGDGDQPNDIQDAEFGTDDAVFRLRSERAGGGDGRVYTITYHVEDACGNTGSSIVYVTVPHDQPGVAHPLAGFVADGTAFQPGAATYSLAVLSEGGLDASEVLVSRTNVGNHLAVLPALESRLTDLNADRAVDLVVTYDVAATLELLARLDEGVAYPVGFRYETQAGVGYWLSDIFALGPVLTDPTTGVDTSTPTGPLYEPRPNPFTAAIAMVYEVGDALGDNVDIAVFNVAGQRIRALYSGFARSGRGEVVWDGRTEEGAPVGAGIYFFRVAIGGKEIVRRVTLLR